MRMYAIVSALLIGGWCGQWARADDLLPPPWRGLPGSTLQVWEMTTSAPTNVPPDSYSNPYGLPLMDKGGQDGVYYPTFLTRSGVWLLQGSLNDYLQFEIPNLDQLNPLKGIQCQVTYWGGALPPTFGAVGYDAAGSPMTTGSLAYVATIAQGDGWLTDIFSATLYPNPNYEIITVAANFGTSVYIDQVVIDTICVPEPATIGLLAAGGLILLRRRRVA